MELYFNKKEKIYYLIYICNKNLSDNKVEFEIDEYNNKDIFVNRLLIYEEDMYFGDKIKSVSRQLNLNENILERLYLSTDNYYNIIRLEKIIINHYNNQKEVLTMDRIKYDSIIKNDIHLNQFLNDFLNELKDIDKSDALGLIWQNESNKNILIRDLRVQFKVDVNKLRYYAGVVEKNNTLDESDINKIRNILSILDLYHREQFDYNRNKHLEKKKIYGLYR